MPTPEVTVLLPTYNRAQWLPRAITSCLSQRSVRLHVIVGDNASTDSTAETMTQFASEERITYIQRQENIGLCRNIHSLVSAPNVAPFAVVMSDDDYFTDLYYLRKALDCFRHHPSIGFVHGEIEYEFSSGSITPNKPRILPSHYSGKEFIEQFGSAGHDYAYLMTVVFKTELARNSGFFADEGIAHGDSLGWLKIAADHDVGFISDVAARYFIHDGNIIGSRNINHWLKDIQFVELFAEYIRRHDTKYRFDMDSWLKKQRRSYCSKVLRMLPQSKSWGEFLGYLRSLHSTHHVLEDPQLALIAIKAAVKRLLGNQSQSQRR